MKARDEDTSWMADAPCQGLTHLFFPTGTDDRTKETPETTMAARAICGRCELRERCLDYAVRWREPCGVWGGSTTAERLGPRRGRAPIARLERRPFT